MNLPALRRILFCIAACFLAAGIPAPAQQNAGEILAHANAEAAAAHKNVMMVFSASWCTPCHMFDAFLTDPETGPIMRKHFAIARFDVGEKPGDKKHADTPGAEKLRASLGGADAGYPYLIALDPSGQVLVNSYRPVEGKPGNADTNIGYPYLHVEIDWFMEMLRRSAPAMSAEETHAVRSWLEGRGEK